MYSSIVNKHDHSTASLSPGAQADGSGSVSTRSSDPRCPVICVSDPRCLLGDRLSARPPVRPAGNRVSPPAALGRSTRSAPPVYVLSPSTSALCHLRVRAPRAISMDRHFATTADGTCNTPQRRGLDDVHGRSSAASSDKTSRDQTCQVTSAAVDTTLRLHSIDNILAMTAKSAEMICTYGQLPPVVIIWQFPAPPRCYWSHTNHTCIVARSLVARSGESVTSRHDPFASVTEMTRTVVTRLKRVESVCA